MVAQARPATAAEPQLADVLARLERRMERIEATLAKLDGMTAQVPVAVATVTDIVDSVVARLAERGINIDDRLHALLRAADHLTSPRALDSLASLLQSEVFAHQTTEVIGRMGRAIVQAEHEAAPLGTWGLLRALRDPEVRRATGFLVAMARHFGSELEDVKQLPPGGES